MRMRSEGYFVCVSVCLSVTTLAATAFISACNQQHLRHYFLGLKLVEFRKTLPFKSYGELVIAFREPFSRTFWSNETHELLEAQPVSRILLQTLATGATGVK